MVRKLLIDAAHDEETRVVVVEGNRVEEFDFESSSKRQTVGNIYLARVARVEAALQAVFVEYGEGRHGFLAFSEIHPDYYIIPAAHRQNEQAKGSEGDAGNSASSPQQQGNSSPPASGEAEADSPVSEEGAAAPPDPESASPLPETLADQESGSGNSTADSELNDKSVEPGSNGGDAAAAARPPSPTGGRGGRNRRRSQKRRYKIQEVIRLRQILLVQVTKDERGTKGAALTTYISLAGRYCVLMPNTPRGGGISRKITNSTDRKKLNDITESINLPEGSGLIIRTAGAKRTRQEIKRDYEYLQRQWDQIRDLTYKSIAPTLIYEEGGLIKRAIRDIYTKSIDKIIVQGDEAYKIAKNLMRLILPSHAKNVQKYSDHAPLFSRYNVEGYLSTLFSPVVHLSSGGYLVIDVTEALVAIDVNSGKATSQGTLEQTALQTNLEAAAEIAHQILMRDLAGLLVIDFIDMDERRSITAVEKCLKESLQVDRSKIQVGRISNFGLLEMSRQRLRSGVIETSSLKCTVCNGTGLVRSDQSLALAVLRQIEEEAILRRQGAILARMPVKAANYLFTHKRNSLDRIEQEHNVSLALEVDLSLSDSEFAIERIRDKQQDAEPEFFVSIETSLQGHTASVTKEAEPAKRPEGPKRRRRGGRGGGSRKEQVKAESRAAAQAPASEESQPPTSAAEEEASPKSASSAAEKKQGRRRKRPSGRRGQPKKQASSDDTATPPDDAESMPAETDGDGSTQAAEAEKKSQKRPRRRKSAQGNAPKNDPAPEDEAAPAENAEPTAAESDGAEQNSVPNASASKPRRKPRRRTTTRKTNKPAEDAATGNSPEPPGNAQGNDGNQKPASPGSDITANIAEGPAVSGGAEHQPAKKRGWWTRNEVQH